MRFEVDYDFGNGIKTKKYENTSFLKVLKSILYDFFDFDKTVIDEHTEPEILRAVFSYPEIRAIYKIWNDKDTEKRMCLVRSAQ